MSALLSVMRDITSFFLNLGENLMGTACFVSFFNALVSPLDTAYASGKGSEYTYTGNNRSITAPHPRGFLPINFSDFFPLTT